MGAELDGGLEFKTRGKVIAAITSATPRPIKAKGSHFDDENIPVLSITVLYEADIAAGVEPNVANDDAQ